MKKILNSFSFALVNGLIYFYVVKNTIILLVFMFSASMLLYFILLSVNNQHTKLLQFEYKKHKNL